MPKSCLLVSISHFTGVSITVYVLLRKFNGPSTLPLVASSSMNFCNHIQNRHNQQLHAAALTSWAGSKSKEWWTTTAGCYELSAMQHSCDVRHRGLLHANLALLHTTHEMQMQTCLTLQRSCMHLSLPLTSINSLPWSLKRSSRPVKFIVNFTLLPCNAVHHNVH